MKACNLRAILLDGQGLSMFQKNEGLQIEILKILELGNKNVTTGIKS